LGRRTANFDFREYRNQVKRLNNSAARRKHKSRRAAENFNDDYGEDFKWIQGDSRGTLPAATQPIYNGDGNTKQGTVDVATLPNVPGAVVASQAFDEPLTKEEVLAIAGMFIRK